MKDKYVIRFRLQSSEDGHWAYGIDNYKIKVYDNKLDADIVAAGFQEYFIDTHVYEVVRVDEMSKKDRARYNI